MRRDWRSRRDARGWRVDNDPIMLRCVIEVSVFALLIGALILIERWRR